ncbi:MAG: MBL fold metallo-hydrolase [Bacteroidales bacterium]|nr:MBL fold metallo-hydrolase [Bacteroidales bacterium]
MHIKTLFLALFVFFSANLNFAQEILPTQKGNLKIHPIQHASMVWEWNGLTLYIDPVGNPTVYNSFAKPDMVFITHSHGDHFSKVTLDGINAEGVPFIVPQEVADKLDDKFKAKLYILPNGENIELSKISIKSVPAYNYPKTEQTFHIKGVGNGYILELGGKRIYISGDTGNIPEMNEIENIDAAFLCMNLPYTMDVDDAAKATLIIQPKVIYPYHYRGKNGFSDLDKFKALVAAGNSEIEVRILDWYGK